MTADRRAQLLLLGAGHAHLEVLRRLAAEGSPPFAATVVAPARHVYSGMVPGYLAGRYRLDEIVFDVPALAARAGAEHVPDLAVGLDPAARRVALAGGGSIEYDLVSLDVGSLAAG
ncbi:MAG TPA: hypothetical protein VHM02_05605, partial [Thermoanaerobaculia bacterium]|nr:hypothetical protein [Thermoanaerobaculia bacterium]